MNSKYHMAALQAQHYQSWLGGLEDDYWSVTVDKGELQNLAANYIRLYEHFIRPVPKSTPDPAHGEALLRENPVG